MIDKTSLRIGNYVMDGEVPVQVIEILENKINHSQAFFCPYEDLNPIPLSEEVLVKCGFKFSHSTAYKVYNKAGMIYLLNKIGSSYESYYLATKIDSLHFLQNHFFFSTKEELVYKP